MQWLIERAKKIRGEITDALATLGYPKAN